MANIPVSDAVKKIKSGEIDNLYYFYGKDILSVGALTKLLLKKTVNSDNYTKIYGNALDLNELSDIIDMYPMFSDYNCILINDFNADEKSADEIKLLLKILENISQTTVVIFNVTGFDVYGGKKTPTAKNKKIIDFAVKYGTVCNCEMKTSIQIVKIITNMVEKRGCKVDKNTAEHIAKLCLYDTMMIKNEVDKLCDYADGKDINLNMVNMLVSKQIDTNAFALARAVTYFRGKDAMNILDELMAEQSEPVVVLSAVSMAFIDLYRAKTAYLKNISQNQVAEDFDYNGRSFVIRNAFMDCQKISIEHLCECLKILRDTDLTLKSTRTDNRIVIEKAIAKMLIASRDR